MTNMATIKQELADAGAYLPDEHFAEWVGSLRDDQRAVVTIRDITSQATGNGDNA